MSYGLLGLRVYLRTVGWEVEEEVIKFLNNIYILDFALVYNFVDEMTRLDD